MTASGRSPRRIRPFTPSQEPAAELSDRTVGRDELLEILIDRLAGAATSRNRPHTLLVGSRGAGKTHLINVAIHRALQRPEVRERLRFVRFDEDAVGITRYFDVLQEVLAALSPSRPGSRRPALPSNPEEAVAEALGDRVLVLVIENLDRIFHTFGEGGQQDLRSWVENSGQVMVLATTPLLFPGVSDRALPWWGNFGISHLDELDVEQGRELLIRLAQSSGDTALAEFLATDKGEARLRAINALAGGSPRIWMILSECLTVESLDELVPAVEALLEGLVPYYQQLLWDLSPVEQRLIRELADGPQQAATVAELAKAAGVEQRVAASTLGRLADIRWVRAEKVPELDKRLSWYRLREPMLRHHFHYRSATDQPLPLIVEILKTWFEPEERRAQLALAESASESERVMAAALRFETSTYETAYAHRNIDDLVIDARRWIHGDHAQVISPDVGALIDVAVTAVRNGSAAAKIVAGLRGLGEDFSQVAHQISEQAQLLNQKTPVEDRVGELIRVAAQSSSGRTSAALELVSACWDGPNDPLLAHERLATLAGYLSQDTEDLLYLLAALESVYWAASGGDVLQARRSLSALTSFLIETLGPDHEVTLLALRCEVSLPAETNNRSLASKLGLVTARERSDFLGGEVERVFRTGLAGDPVSARKQSAALVSRLATAMDPLDPYVDLNMCGLALWMAQTGEIAKGSGLAAALVDRLSGQENPDDAVWAIALQIFSLCLVMLATDVRTQTAPVVADAANLGLAATMLAAVGGSADALVRLPSELVEIVDSIRAVSEKARLAGRRPETLLQVIAGSISPQ